HSGGGGPGEPGVMAAGAWCAGEGEVRRGEPTGLIPFGGRETAREFRENLEAPFFRYYLHGKGDKPLWQATMFQSGSNQWRTYAVWPPKEAKPTKLYLHADGTLSLKEPAPGSTGYGENV